MNDSVNTYFEIKAKSDLIRIDVIKPNFPKAELDWDKNSLHCLVSTKIGAFSGTFKADMMSTDFEIFKKELEIVYDNLDHSATFEGIESQVTIRIEGDGIGHLNTRCWLMDKVGTGNELKCEFNFDQTALPKLIEQLDNIISQYKVYGKMN